MEKLLNRFVNYAKINTRSDESSKSCPSTQNQFNLAEFLKRELIDLGLKDAEVDENCYLTATLESNIEKDVPVLGLIAHMDTSPDYSAENVDPIVWQAYDGNDLILNKDKNIILKVSDFPELTDYIGQTIITSNGNTLLGADDKAGIAEIVSAIEYLKDNPGIKHGKIRLGFTPDEEIGRGADLFDVNKFGADFAYTIDGGRIGELEFENFNAAKAIIKVNGRNVHPGTAKGKMINAIEVAMRFNSILPSFEKPEYTEGYEGFCHIMNMVGNVSSVEMRYIIRDHDMKKFEKKKTRIKHIAELINNDYGSEVIQFEITDQYYNMREKIEPVFHIINIAETAFHECSVEPIIKPIRGGTDGSKLSFMGLPTPNIFTGGHNYHGPYEYIPLESMQKAVEVIVKISEKIAEK